MAMPVSSSSSTPAGCTLRADYIYGVCYAGLIEKHDPMYLSFAGLIEKLVVRGADVSLSNRQGLTPLHCAAQMGHIKVPFH